MIAICRALDPTPEQAAALEIRYEGLGRYMVTVGKKYVVLGISFPKGAFLLGNDVALAISENNQYIVDVPLVLFDVLDSRVSAKWVFGRNRWGVSFAPPSFFIENYREDLIDRNPSIMKDFRRVYADLRVESGLDAMS